MSYGKITEKQQEILDFLKSEILSKGFPPSVHDR
jgi:repressor LexA